MKKHTPAIEDDELVAIRRLLHDVGAWLMTSELTEVREKGPQDIVSDLDVRAEACVKTFLAERFPEDSLLSEETAASVPYAQRLWVLDPLDGTVNRTGEMPFWAISLALLEHGVPVAAFVYDPVHGELFEAQRGCGATLNGAPLQIAIAEPRAFALTSGVVRRLAACSPEALEALLRDHGKLRSLGAQALHLAYVAAGRLGAAVSLETKLWDNAAGALLVTEAGGVFCDLQRRDPFPIGPGDPSLQGAVCPCIAASPTVLTAIYPLIEALGTSPRQSLTRHIDDGVGNA